MTSAVVGVVCALASEARHFGARVSGEGRIQALRDGTLIVVSGMGGIRAAHAARELIAAGASALTSFGMAGGLNPALPPGTIVLPAEVVSTDGTVIATDREWLHDCSVALASRQTLQGGRLLTSATAITSVQEKARWFRSTGAAAVDMESVAIAKEAAACGLRFIAIRAIVDAAGDALPESVRDATDGAGRVRIKRLLVALPRRPQDLPALARLAHRYVIANRALAFIAESGAISSQWAALA